VAPCFEYSATMAIFTVEGQRILDQSDVSLQSRVPHDRVRLMKAQEVDVVICGGVQAFYEDLLRACGIRVISWVTGDVEDLLTRYLEGRLVSGAARPADVYEPATGMGEQRRPNKRERTNL
jgi:predicted Fe-Mo cluster-binding NifX family protein